MKRNIRLKMESAVVQKCRHCIFENVAGHFYKHHIE